MYKTVGNLTDKWTLPSLEFFVNKRLLVVLIFLASVNIFISPDESRGYIGFRSVAPPPPPPPPP